MPITPMDPVAMTAKYIAKTTAQNTSPAQLATLAQAQSQYGFSAPIVAAINAITKGVMANFVVPATKMQTVGYRTFGQLAAKTFRVNGGGLSGNAAFQSIKDDYVTRGYGSAELIQVAAAQGLVVT